MAEKKDRFALISKYKQLVRAKNFPEENINIHTQQWAADAIIESYGIQEAFDIIEYYVSIAQSPSWKWLSNNADKVLDGKRAKIDDERTREVLRKQAKEWLSK